MSTQQPPQSACNYIHISWLLQMRREKKMSCVYFNAMQTTTTKIVVVIPIQLSDHKVFLHLFISLQFIDSNYCTCLFIAHSFISRIGFKTWTRSNTHTHIYLCRRHIRFLMWSSSLLVVLFLLSSSNIVCNEVRFESKEHTHTHTHSGYKSYSISFLKSKERSIETKKINQCHQIETWMTTFFCE